MASTSTPEIKLDNHSADTASTQMPELLADKDRNKKLYKALMHGEKDNVLQLCQEFSEGPFHVVTIHNDTVLHVAASTKQADLVLKLLERVSADQVNKLTLLNKVGNTILHEACTSDNLVQAAKQMLIKAPELFNMRNIHGVSPIYMSVQFGRMKMFKFLDEIFRKQEQTTDTGDLVADSGFYYCKNSVLHRAVASGSFDLAHFIAERYKHLIDELDDDGMTALQLLSCYSSAFKSRSGVLTKQRPTAADEAGRWRVPYWDAIQGEREKYESAVKLAKFLIEKDISWMETKNVASRKVPKIHRYAIPAKNEQEHLPIAETPQEHLPIAETPLFLATKHGCLEIVKEILGVHPWAVEHIDAKGRTILHVAVRYRQMEVIDLVEQMGLLVERLERRLDKDFNTILHMVGEKAEYRTVRQLRSPALELQENLLFFERVEEICPISLRNTLNIAKKTALKLFEEENEELRGKAKDWLQRTAEHCSIVAVLIATVAFTAAYTIPGGPDQNTGLPLLLNNPLFVVFTLTDVLSLTFALTSVIFFLRILTAPFRFKDFKYPLPQILMLGVTLLIFSVSMMMLAFAATVILLIHKRKPWTEVALYTAALLPVTIFTFSYLPLYLSLMKTCNYSLKKMAMFFPRFTSYPRNFEPKQLETVNTTYPPKHQASLV